MAEPKRPVLVGGPLDGATLAPKARPAFIYCAEAADRNGLSRATAFLTPGAGRELYRSVGIVAGIEQYVYAGHAFRRCDGCGGYYRRRRRRCGFCGCARATSPESVKT